MPSPVASLAEDEDGITGLLGTRVCCSLLSSHQYCSRPGSLEGAGYQTHPAVTILWGTCILHWDEPRYMSGKMDGATDIPYDIPYSQDSIKNFSTQGLYAIREIVAERPQELFSNNSCREELDYLQLTEAQISRKFTSKQ
ncbi:hypothetical protein TURU_137165 [Turdus rufiventris]|nr:hypothetical protein TURU_137165 [Turdus rufiventris]